MSSESFVEAAKNAVSAIDGLLSFNTSTDEYRRGREAREELKTALEQEEGVDSLYKAGFNNAIRESLTHVQGALDRIEPGKHKTAREILLTLEARIKRHEKK